MRFEKIKEVVEGNKNYIGYLKIRILKSSDSILSLSDETLIDGIIQSKYHHWRGEEEPNGLTVGMSSTDKYGKSISWTLENHKFYGYFDNSKIQTSHYRKLTFDSFCSMLINAIESETENDRVFIQAAKRMLSENITSASTCYFLDLEKERNRDLVAVWQVYSFFYAFISIDRLNNLISITEFGLD